MNKEETYTFPLYLTGSSAQRLRFFLILFLAAEKEYTQKKEEKT